MPIRQTAVTKRALLWAGIAAIALGLIWAMMPRPVDADTGIIERSHIRVTVDEEGKTRIKDIFAITAPIAGTAKRSPLNAGDPVSKNETVVAVIQPPPPPFRDLRTSLELESQVRSCEANVDLAESEVRQAAAEFDFAKSEYERAKTLTQKGVSTATALERAATNLRIREAAVTRATAALEFRKRELDSAKVRRLGPEQPEVREASGAACTFDVKSPESGRVLKLIVESEQAVAIGAPLLEIGNPSNLEVVVELLSADAVKIKEGAKATIENWGGPPLNAHVATIEPSGFTKISALGIEEQRVKTILALDDPPETWRRLGHDYRVFVKINVYEAANALVVPLGALFRQGDAWSVFVVRDGRAVSRHIKLGQRNTSHAEVLEGLKDGERVILHPSDRILDGVRVRQRSNGS